MSVFKMNLYKDMHLVGAKDEEGERAGESRKKRDCLCYCFVVLLLLDTLKHQSRIV